MIVRIVVEMGLRMVVVLMVVLKVVRMVMDGQTD